MKELLHIAFISVLLLAHSHAADWVHDSRQKGAFPLVDGRKAANIFYSAEDFKVVSIAATDLARDIHRVTAIAPAILTDSAKAGASAVLIGTLGKSPLIDGLVKSGKLDVSALQGEWESFVICTVSNPLPKVAHGLVIVGSDRRGTAFGAYELSQAIGVSPWHWWADVSPERKRVLYVADGTKRFGPPSVKYRGIFINDEDWGLQPWAAKTFEPERGDIGPKTYARVFELLLRLKANTLWPAMHECTKPFNEHPLNKFVADDYAIVMGSSHAEPMLRNNVGEWKAGAQEFNFASNRDGVLKYWEERVSENGRFENIYTLGMRGIHDSGMQGGRTAQERVRLLDQIFVAQRELLKKHVNPAAEQVPQMFCAYKEVLDLYRSGLKVPDDVTIVWPDDNFGYIRNFASDTERQRKGGFGVYYHISYLGRPLAYLWLNTTPPALIWEEMNRAYAHGADRIWIANVGDIKPAEIGIEFFLQMAWDIKRWDHQNLPDFLHEWAKREFGERRSERIAQIMDRYYRLNFQRKPEHLQWWLPQQPLQLSPFTVSEIEQRLEAFAFLKGRAMRTGNLLRENQRDGFFQLVEYPVIGAALANERYFMGERAAVAAANGQEAAAKEFAAKAEAAGVQLTNLTEHFDKTVSAGKWKGLMQLEPADRQWRGMRIEPPKVPELTNSSVDYSWKLAKPERSASRAKDADVRKFVEIDGVVSIEAEHFSSSKEGNRAQWEVIPGLGRSGDSVTVLPATMYSVDVADIAAAAPRLDYEIQFKTAGEFTVQFQLIPTHPTAASGKLRLAVALNDQTPQLVTLDVRDGSTEWAQGVLNATRVLSTRLKVPAAGTHVLRVHGPDTGVVMDKIVIDCGGLKQNPGYLGPEETVSR
jgi:hypothetical protein